MAASCRLCGVLRIGQQLGQFQHHARVSAHQLQQVRFKKGSGRVKAPPVHAEKETKFTFKRKKTAVVQEVKLRDLKPIAEDNVWMEKYYEPVRYDLLNAIQMHREFCQPSMLNVPTAKLNLSMQLDLRTKKKSKFMSGISKTLVLPHDFVDGPPNRVMVFVKDEDLQKLADELGAEFVGGTELIKAIEKGDIHHDSFDHVVSHVDMVSEIPAVRKFLRDLFPTKPKGNLGPDIRTMVSKFASGKTYESEKLEEAVGTVSVNIGTLDMTDEQLMANHDTFIESICSHRSPDLGPFITQGILSCSPSLEKFLIDTNLLRPISQRKVQVTQLEQEEEEVVQKEDVDSDDEEEQPQAAKKKNK